MIRKETSGTRKNSQKLEKNFGELDCISRTAVLKLIYDYKENHSENRNEYPINYGTLLDMIRWVRDLPSVPPQEPQTFKWCTDCKEYDQEKHCCHRWSKVIRDTVEEMKEEYIERDVLDKIITEVKIWRKDDTNWSDIRLMNIEDIIDKYKAETEEI